MTDITDPTPAPTGGEGSGSPSGTTVKEQATSVASSVATEAKSVAHEAAGEAKDVFGDVRQQLRVEAEEQSARVAALVGDIGGQLRRMATAAEAGPTRDVVAGLADQAQQLSRRMGDGGLDGTLDDARRVARTRPGLFLAGAALAGFVAARVGRAVDTSALKDAATAGGGREQWTREDAAMPAPAVSMAPGGTATGAPR